ncbi:MAG: hypothetical protein HUK20_06005 [Fibrobacter sp.]|nr:hypothetical protein [Fibrobacter sp.]
MKIVDVDPDDMQPWEYSCDVECPYCGDTNFFVSLECSNYEEVVTCDCCENEFKIVIGEN